MHLWFLVHGLYGSHGNLECMQDILASAIPESDRVYVARSNERFWTFDGIEVGALRLHRELMSVISKSTPPVTQISIVGYSLGGLYSRYLIGLLEETGFFDLVKPVIFATFATPHLGTTLWSPPYASWLLNGMGSVLLGVSGAQLMNRSGWGVIHSLSDPGSSSFKGLKRFRQRVLFANAINDRTVHFWTAFITNKVPFAENHHNTTDLVFFSYSDDPQGRFILDLQRSQHLTQHRSSPASKSGVPIFLVIFGLPIFLLCLSLVSLRTWICYPFIKAKWLLTYDPRAEYCRTCLSRLDTSGLNEAQDGQQLLGTVSSHSSDSSSAIGDQLQDTLDSVAPKDNQDGNDDDLTADSVTPLFPQPVLENEAPFVDSATMELPFGEALTRRMLNLNSLKWEKYAVYIDHYRSHAQIINRRNQDDSKGSELMKFFVDQALKV